MSFVHLNVHSVNSVMDGLASIDDLVAAAVREDQGALALTDSGNLFGAMAFHRKCLEAGVKPILGYEANITLKEMRYRGKPADDTCFPLTLLAQNRTGWSNLVKLASLASGPGFLQKPRLDRDTLATHAAGLIALSGGIHSEIWNLLRARRSKPAVDLCSKYQRIFGKNFYLEIQNFDRGFELGIADSLSKIGHRLGIRLAATNGVRFIRPDAAPAFRVLRCIAEQTTVPAEWPECEEDPRYFKSEAEMHTALLDYPDAVHWTGEIAQSCETNFDLRVREIAEFPVPPGFTSPDYLRRLCEAGLWKRYPGATDEIRLRLDQELHVITEKGLVGTFLILWDLVQHAERDDLPIGPGFGKMTGSVVSYVLGITGVDPIRFGLPVEPFLSLTDDRPPSLTIDAGKDGRDRLIDHVRERYGSRRVCLPPSLVSFNSRSAVYAVGDALKMNRDVVTTLSRLIPLAPAGSGKGGWLAVSEAKEVVPELRQACDSDSSTRTLMEVSSQIQGAIRVVVPSPVGVAVFRSPLGEVVPSARIHGELCSGFPRAALGELGAACFDICATTDVTLVHETLRAIERELDHHLDLRLMPLDDAATYKLIGEGRTLGIFTLEREEMKAACRTARPGNFQELVSLCGGYHASALRAYRMAWLKANYPAQTMRALVATEQDDDERRAALQEECRALGISITPTTP